MLTVSSYWPTEGSPVTLTCETRPAPQRSNVQLQFCFFRDGKALGSGWSSSPALRVPAMWTEDSGSYWCQAETATLTVRKQSLQSRIHVQSKYPWVSAWGVRQLHSWTLVFWVLLQFLCSWKVGCELENGRFIEITNGQAPVKNRAQWSEGEDGIVFDFIRHS